MARAAEGVRCVREIKRCCWISCEQATTTTRSHKQFTLGFIEERDIGQEKLAGLAAFLRRGGPLLADARMEDLLERALLFRVGEHYRSKCAPIQISVCRKNFNPKALS